MPCGLLHILKLPAVLERGRDECRSHRVRRIAAVEAELAGVFPYHAIDRVRVHAPTLVVALAIVFERPEQGPVDIGAVPGYLEIGADACSGLGIDRERVAPASLARHAQ